MAALKAYKKLAKILKGWEIMMNQYDPCVWNGEGDGKQMTLVFHADDIFMAYAK